MSHISIKLFSKTISLTSANIQTGNSIPIVLVASPGAGKAVNAWHDTTARIINGAVPAVASNMDIKSTGGADPHCRFGLPDFMGSANGNPVRGDDSLGVGRNTTILENTDLIAVFDADNPLFDGTGIIYLKYEIINL